MSGAATQESICARIEGGDLAAVCAEAEAFSVNELVRPGARYVEGPTASGGPGNVVLRGRMIAAHDTVGAVADFYRFTLVPRRGETIPWREAAAPRSSRNRALAFEGAGEAGFYRLELALRALPRERVLVEVEVTGTPRSGP